MVSFSVLFVATEWLLRIVMIPIVTRRRGPTSALAWLVVIFAQPMIGVVIYLLVGGNRLGRRRARLHEQVVNAMQTVERLGIATTHKTRPAIPAAQQPLVNLAMNMAGSPILGGNAVEIIADTRAFIDRLVADIDRAKHNVHLLFYIFRDDGTGRQVAEALARAERRGVQCRVLYDAAGSRRLIGELGAFFDGNGIDHHAVLPVNPVRRRLERLDLRNHRKIAVIDGTVAYAGSQNIVDDNYGHKDLAWRDMMLRVVGPATLHLQLVFLEDWYFATDRMLDGASVLPPPATPGEVPVQVVPSGPTYPTETYQHLVVEAIHNVHHRLILTTPYFIPDEASLLALKLAVMRGARVDVVVPERIDHPLVAAASRSYYEELLEAGVRVHRFTEGLLHAKTITVDDSFAMVGSANFDIRSFHLNFEINLLLYGSEVTAQLRFMQQHYIDGSYQLDPVAWSTRPRHRVMLEDAARLLSPLL